jgi:hypothetical protein
MTKTVEIALWDDLDAAEGKRTRAAQTVKFSVRGKRLELELTDEHAAEFDADLARWVKAAHSPDAVPGTAGPRSRYLKDGPQDVTPGGETRRQFRLAIRDWADKHDKRDRKDPSRMAYLAPGGSFTYPRWLMEEYEAWLLEQAGA